MAIVLSSNGRSPIGRSGAHRSDSPGKILSDHHAELFRPRRIGRSIRIEAPSSEFLVPRLAVMAVDQHELAGDPGIIPLDRHGLYAPAAVDQRYMRSSVRHPVVRKVVPGES